MTLYARRDTKALGEYYTRHLAAMADENLRTKSAIAAELAWRDREIAELSAAIYDFQRDNSAPASTLTADTKQRLCAAIALLEELAK